MRILLDTHVWLWWLSEPERLPDTICEEIEEGRNQPLVSVVSSWEIAIKYSLGKIALPELPEKFVLSRLQREGFDSLRIEHRHALAVSALPHHHRDPFDRLLIAQAIAESIPVATVDPVFAKYEVKVI